MFKVFIWAADLMYQGHAGMEDYCIEEVRDWNEAEVLAEQMSYDVINSYSAIYGAIEEEVAATADDNMSEDEYESLYEETAEGDLCWRIWKIKEEAIKGMSERELYTLIDQEGMDYFVENYCDERY